MPTPAQRPLPFDPPRVFQRVRLEIGADTWLDIAERVQGFIAEHGLDARKVLVILPFAQHLPLARHAWAQAHPDGWMPRFETTQTLLAALPARSPHPDGATGDLVADRLAAAQFLAGQRWAEPVRRRDPAAFRQWVELLAGTAHQFMQAAASLLPSEREAYWSRARLRLGASTGPGSLESALVRTALEWAAASEYGASDALFGLRPSAWVVVRAAGFDALATAVIQAGEAPVLEIETDPAPEAMIDGQTRARIVACADFEDEAQLAAAQIIRHLEAGQSPVALIAQDRTLVRRVRALLERQHVSLRDDTGWKLSTTRAGACVAGLLEMARHRAATDGVLDWLKSAFVQWPDVNSALALSWLERCMREQQAAWMSDVHVAQLPPAAQRLWQAVLALVQGMAATRQASLDQWQHRLREALQSCGAWTALDADEAGRQVLRALRLQEGTGAGAFARAAQATIMDLPDFAAWVDGVLEVEAFAPSAAQEPEVIITPLSRALLRPFAAVVMPGCDERSLGATASIPGWLSEAERADLALPTRARARDQEIRAFAHLLRHDELTLLWRQSQEGEPLNPAVLLERVRVARLRAGHAEPAWTDPREDRSCMPAPVNASQPRAPGLVPERLSATSYEALRACPYRFFALGMLGLQAAEELDDEIERRDYGTWLHAVLKAFHDQRAHEPLEETAEVARLQEIALEQQQAFGLDEAAFLPYAARFNQVARFYVQWLIAHEHAGARFAQGEVALRSRTGSVEFHGKLDRIDLLRGNDGESDLIIDYKTGSYQGLKEKLRVPLEDTQLPFYAALWLASDAAQASPRPVRAMYLAMDGGKIAEAEHLDVQDSAGKLLQGLESDLHRIAAGAALPPLGEGSVCDYCEARGLCRKDHWTDPVPAAFDEEKE
jgi:ATP-dependent helicase/nuclease subunit B